MLWQMGLFHSFSWLSNIPGRACVCLCHILFIHSSVHGHLGCFHILAVVNSPAVNIGEHVSFQIMFFFKYMPRIIPVGII